MPIDILDITKLIGGMILLVIPGYLWSYFFFKDLMYLERIVFGFVLSISFFTLSLFCLDLILNIPVTYTKIWILYAIYSITIFILCCISINKYGLPQKNTHKFINSPIIQQQLKNPQWIWLLGIIIFAAIMGFLPHLKDAYYLPFHVDEWIHWTYSESFMESGSTSFINPYVGKGITRSLEPGFNYIIATFAWLTDINFNTIFVFMPTVLSVFMSITAYNLGQRHALNFGLEAAFCIAVIPTTCRMLGPGFFVPLTICLFLLVFLLWYLQQKKHLLLSLFVPVLIFVIFIIHPPTALAAIIVTFLYALMLLAEKEYKTSFLYIIFCLIPIAGAFLLSARWVGSINLILDAFLGGTYSFDYNLPQIWVSFKEMSIVVWVLSIVGVYITWSKGKIIVRTIVVSALTFIMLIGLYSKLGYGFPTMYERSFMYLFLMITILGGWGLAALKKIIETYTTNMLQNTKRLKPDSKNTIFLRKNIGLSFILVLFCIIGASTIPVQSQIPYYHMITESDYEAFQWIHDNIASYRDANHSYKRAAVNPYYASPFSSITRLYIISSTMHPIPGYSLHTKVEAFLNNKCRDTAFMDTYNISVVYTKNCDNANLTMIHPRVYIYP